MNPEIQMQSAGPAVDDRSIHTLDSRSVFPSRSPVKAPITQYNQQVSKIGVSSDEVATKSRYPGLVALGLVVPTDPPRLFHSLQQDGRNLTDVFCIVQIPIKPDI